jgi:hypothetical protein
MYINKSFDNFINESAEADTGIDPMSVTSDEKSFYSLNQKLRRVAWVNLDADDIVKARSMNLGLIKMYDTNIPKESKIAKTKIDDLSKHGWSKIGAENIVDMEYLIYIKKFKKQAEAAHNEFLKRQGWWKQENAVDDIYLARLMGYGEQYIIPFIRKNYPNFDVDTYIEKIQEKKQLNKK